MELASGAEHTRRLEIALKNADFRVDAERVWRWETVQGGSYKAVIKFELLADLDDQLQGANVHVDNTEKVANGARGSGRQLLRRPSPGHRGVRRATPHQQPGSRRGSCCY